MAIGRHLRAGDGYLAVEQIPINEGRLISERRQG